MSSDEEVSIVSTSNIDKGKKVVKNIGRPEGPVWSYFTKGKQVGKGKYEATCNLCGVTWNRGEPSELENHLANHCQKADSIIVRQFLTKILSNNSEQGDSSKKRKINIQGPLDQYVSLTKLDNQKIKRIHFAWSKAFTICGISWRVIENPFFIEALKEMNLSYEPPTRQLLSNNLLEQQLAI
ncbi:8575_t:CDS:1, partial [Gigaspora rosea]